MNLKRNPVGWFEIYVDDMERAKFFYQNTFQVTLEHMENPELEMWVFPKDADNPGCSSADRPGCPGAIVKMEGMSAGGGGGTLIYFSCEDCAEEELRVAASGGQVFKSKFSIGPYGYIALVNDSEGNMIGLHSNK
jgi:predicted enzyme related to lactoylglutathione lyase